MSSCYILNCFKSSIIFALRKKDSDEAKVTGVQRYRRGFTEKYNLLYFKTGIYSISKQQSVVFQNINRRFKFKFCE